MGGPTADIGATVFGGTVGTSALCFDNSADVDDSVVVFPGEELVDWGTLDCGLTGIVGGFRIQIQTTAIDTGVGGPGASIGIGFWKGHDRVRRSRHPDGALCAVSLHGDSRARWTGRP